MFMRKIYFIYLEKGKNEEFYQILDNVKAFGGGTVNEVIFPCYFLVNS